MWYALFSGVRERTIINIHEPALELQRKARAKKMSARGAGETSITGRRTSRDTWQLAN